ncbi:hypothetical protein [Acinetobacter sp. CWB-B33]|uniref:hypothetical protein n=1 Tax=Acinetobacter sp. CWB-B33 TaxID=2815724 RepID=UPI0031FF2817
MNDGKKEDKILGIYYMVNPFDKNQKDRIKNFIKLNGICIFHHNFLSQSIGLNEGESGKSFFSALVDISNVALTWHIFDEISASLENRGPLKELIEEVKSNVFNDENFNMDLEWPYALAFKDLEYRTFDPELMYTDFINSSLFQDFIVGTYSAFEHWMTKIYDHINNVSSVIDSRKMKVTKIISNKKNKIKDEEEKAVIERWLEEVQDQISDEIIKKFGNYVSASEKIDKVLSTARNKFKDKFQNNKDGIDQIEQTDIDLVKFYAAQRNSIHNLGKHSKSLNISFYGVKINADEPSYFENKSDHINLCLDLAMIFIKVITILEIEHNILLEREVTQL